VSLIVTVAVLRILVVVVVMVYERSQAPTPEGRRRIASSLRVVFTGGRRMPAVVRPSNATS
jgi:hypothetical protein